MVFVDQRRAAAEVDGDDGEGFVHGQDEVAGAVDAFAVAEGFGEELAEDDADVFDGVVLVDVEIAIGFELEVEAAVFGEELQHVVEEADAGGDLVAAAAFDVERAGDLRFFGVSVQRGGAEARRFRGGGSWRTSSSSLMSSRMAKALFGLEEDDQIDRSAGWRARRCR